MKQGIFEIIENEKLTADVMRMKLEGDVSAVERPGQFVNIKIDGFFLRRPISVCDLQRKAKGSGQSAEGILTLIYKVVGKGTEAMAVMRPDKELDLLTGLGNGYDTKAAGDSPLLVGGGAGVPPMYWLARSLAEEGRKIRVILGFNSKNEVFYEDEFKALGADTEVTTVDGSAGIKGFVTEVMDLKPYSYFYACGPEPMLRAICNKSASQGQLSFEERMGCGFGACMGCSCQTLTGNKRICKDGPVMLKEEILWQI